MTGRNITTEVVKDAVTFPRTRLGEPRTIEPEDFDRWLARVKREAARDAWDEGARWAFEEITGEPEKRFGLAPGDNPYREGND